MADLKDMMDQMNQNPPELDPKPPTPSPPEPKSGEAPVPTPVIPPAKPAEPVIPKPGDKPVDTPKPAVEPKNNTAPTEPKPGDAPTPAPVVDVPDEAFYGRLSKLTGDAIKSEKDFVGLINHYNELLDQSEKGFTPQFKDERAKLVHQLLTDNPGREPEAAMRTLRALNFNPEGKSAQDKLFEAYLLDPKNSDLGPIEAQKFFEAEYNKKYSDLEDNIITQREHALAVREAEQNIKKVQDSFKASEEQPQKISEQVQQSINDAVDNFGGIKMAFTDNPQESDFLNMAVEDPTELESIKQDLSNPQEWWNNLLQGFTNEKGFDYPALIREFYEMRNHEKKAQLAFQHGRKMEEVFQLNKARNASDPTKIEDVGQPGASPAAGPKSVQEAWLASESAKG